MFLPPLSADMLFDLKDEVIIAYDDRWDIHEMDREYDFGYVYIVRPNLPKE